MVAALAIAGFAVLATALENDDALARSFFKDLGILGYGGATLPDDLYMRMQRLAVKYTGNRIVFFTGWGSTETAPTATSTYWAPERVGLIGLPHPGVELKMVPAGPKYEMRIRSVIVTPGYYRQPDLTAKAFGYGVKPNFTVENEAAVSKAPTVYFNTPSPAPAGAPK